MKARVKLFWTLSPSPDVAKREIEVSTAAGTIVAEVPLGVNEFLYTAESDSTLVFKTRVYDSANNVAESQSFTFVVPDLEAPLPDTELGATILEVIPDEPPA